MMQESLASKIIPTILITILIITAACSTTKTLTPDSELDNQPYFFPKQDAADGERGAMAALIIGTLIVENDCIRVNDDESNTSYLLVWPPDFTLETTNDVPQIIDGDGNVMAHIGDSVQIDGGEVKSSLYFSESIQEMLSPNCPGPYWIVGYDVSRIE